MCVLSIDQSFTLPSMYYITVIYITFVCFQVKEELDLAGDETKVFKLIGPALVNQDLSEAKGNVEKRIEYIRYRLFFWNIYCVLSISLTIKGCVRLCVCK